VTWSDHRARPFAKERDVTYKITKTRAKHWNQKIERQRSVRQKFRSANRNFQRGWSNADVNSLIGTASMTMNMQTVCRMTVP